MQHKSLIIYLPSLSRASPTTLTCRLGDLGRTKSGLLPRAADSGQRCLGAEMTQWVQPCLTSIGVLTYTHTAGGCVYMTVGSPWRGWPPQVTGALLQREIKANTLSRLGKQIRSHQTAVSCCRENVPMEKPTSDCSSWGPKTSSCSAAASELWKT